MGWFLRSGGANKPAKKKKSRAAAKADPAERAARKKRALMAASWAIAVGGLVGAWLIAEPWLRGQVQPATPAKPEVVLTAQPKWMPDALANHLLAQARAHLSANPFDQASLEAIATQMVQSHWVDQMHRVSRGPDGTIAIEATYRRPAALVQSGGRWYLIDENAVRLPMFRSRPLLQQAYAMIGGVRQAPPALGRAWQGQDIRAGLNLATLAASQPWASQVRSIDVTNHDGRRQRNNAHLVMRTHRGGQVLWGRAPGAEGIHEPTAATKLAHLRQVQQEHDGRIDAGGRGWRVDITSDAVWKEQVPLPQANR